MKEIGNEKSKKMDFSQVRVNCSRIHMIMAPSKDAITPIQLDKIDKYLSKEKPLTDRQQQELNSLLDKRDSAPEVSFSSSAQSYLLFLYRVRKYGRQYTMRGSLPDAMIKGLKKEKSAVDLISEAYEIDLFRDKKQIKNDYLVGAVDIMDAATIELSDKVYEIKNSYDLSTFLKSMNKPLDKRHFLQMQGYLGITGKKYGEICYCLTEHPEETIQDQKDIIMAEMCPDGIITDKFERYWEFVERKLRYSDIPARERVFSHLVERDESIIDRVYERVDDARSWLYEYALFHNNAIKNRYLDAKKVRI